MRLARRSFSRTWYAATRSGDVTPTYQIDLIELLRRQLGSGPANVVDVSRASLRRKRESAT